jgi:phosphoglycerol transferase MdoB-like AlkP superfamily enzyme
MIALWGILSGILLFMEAVYHVGCFGFTLNIPILTIPFIITMAGVLSLILGAVPPIWKKRLFFLCYGLLFILFAAQVVYMNIFKQPLLWEAAVRGGQDAITNYWREALEGILFVSPFLLMLALPLIAAAIVFHRQLWVIPSLHKNEKLWTALFAATGLVLSVGLLIFGKITHKEYYEEYNEFYDPQTIAQEMGVLVLAQRDTTLEIQQLVGTLHDNLSGTGGIPPTVIGEPIPQETDSSQQTQPTEEEQETETESETEEADALPDTSPHVLPIDIETLLQAAGDSKEETWLAEYIRDLTPTNANAFTGIFEGYNLIFLTAEGFSSYAVREDLTPTLYRLTHSGFVFPNYYVPLWQTSTSDGEYVNCTALIPDGQFSMRKCGSNSMSFTLPRYFAAEGVPSLAYHNNSLSYYDRYLTHTNLGYTFKAASLGELSEEEYGSYIFPMANPGKWPASDLEMMEGTVPEYIGMDRFHVYYMTVSGHMNYNFRGNAMSSKNKEAVENLPMSENAKAYIACHIELDKALEYLIEQLTLAGKLENTVICLSADHYPYAMTEEQYDELAGQDLSQNLDKFRNSLILWNVGMEEQPVIVEKTCGAMDLVPTLLNLFGFSYDSRLYAGRDIFSDQEGMVICNDRSFVTDTVCYNRKAKTTVWTEGSALSVTSPFAGWTYPENAVVIPGRSKEAVLAEGASLEEEQEAYLTAAKQDVKYRYQFSAYVLQKNYYSLIDGNLGRDASQP